MGYLLYEFLQSHSALEGPLSFLRLLNYISFRSSFAFFTSFVFTLVFGRKIIAGLYKKGIRETPRNEVDVVVRNKQGTPTMGGLIIILSVLISAFLWCDLKSLSIILPLSFFVCFVVIRYIVDHI